MPRHHHHRHGELSVRGPFLEQGDPVGIRHPDGQQYQIGAFRVSRGTRRCRILCDDNVVTFVTQDLGQQLSDTDFVVNDKNVSHMSLSLVGARKP